MEIDSTNTEPTLKKTSFENPRFDDTVCFNTVDRLTISFDQNRGKRKGSMAFHDRIREKNQQKYPWAASRTINALSNVIECSSKIKQKCKSQNVYKNAKVKMCAKSNRKFYYEKGHMTQVIF